VKLDPGVPGQNSFGQGVSFAANRLRHVDFDALLSLLSSGRIQNVNRPPIVGAKLLLWR
jgi:hypothetical protein